MFGFLISYQQTFSKIQGADVKVQYKVGTNEAYNIKIKISVVGINILKIFCFGSYTSMAASDKGISLRMKILEKVFSH